jgi:hypothetical protein
MIKGEGISFWILVVFTTLIGATLTGQLLNWINLPF